MNADLAKPSVLLVCSVLYWMLVCWVTGVKEPWDAHAYGRLWYPVSLFLAGVGGVILNSRAWMAGVIVTLAQFPSMLMHSATGPLLPAGLIILCVLAIPAVAISALSGWIAARVRSK